MCFLRSLVVLGVDIVDGDEASRQFWKSCRRYSIPAH